MFILKFTTQQLFGALMQQDSALETKGSEVDDKFL